MTEEFDFDETINDEWIKLLDYVKENFSDDYEDIDALYTTGKEFDIGKKIIEKTDTGKNLGKIGNFVENNIEKIILGSMAGTGLYTAYTQGKLR